jgi:hypothetical protein
MRPTRRFCDRARLALGGVERVEPGIGVGLQNPCIAGEMPFGMHAFPIGRVEVHRGRRRSTGERPIIAYIGPQPPGPRLHFGQDRHCRVVAMDPLGREHVRLDQLIEWHQRRRAGADMIGHGRHRELDALAGKLIALPVERLMIGVFVDQDHRQQARAGEAARDHVERCRRLRDLLARAAAELLAHVLGHEQLPRHRIERPRDVLADLRQLASATARAEGRRRMNDPPARQVIGEVPTYRLAACEAAHLDGRRLSLGLVLARRRSQLLELQLELIEQALAAL